MNKNEKFKVKIGLETHIRLNSDTKLFCDCVNKQVFLRTESNMYVCQICLGQHGTIPSLKNIAHILQKAITFGMYMNATIANDLKFDRKHYVYHDLLRGYQITQDRLPIATNGSIQIHNTYVHIEKMCLEEDAGKTVSQENWFKKNSVDFNRAGTPLLEVVTAPDFNNVDDVLEYLKVIQKVCLNLSIIHPESSESLRCDVNISYNNGQKTELKNLNSMMEIKNAVLYELERQKQIGGNQYCETRFWDSEKNVTYVARKKAKVEYIIIPEYDLPVFSLHNTQYISKLDFSSYTNSNFWVFYYNVLCSNTVDVQLKSELWNLSQYASNAFVKFLSQFNFSELKHIIKIAVLYFENRHYTINETDLQNEIQLLYNALQKNIINIQSISEIVKFESILAGIESYSITIPDQHVLHQIEAMLQQHNCTKLNEQLILVRDWLKVTFPNKNFCMKTIVNYVRELNKK